MSHVDFKELPYPQSPSGKFSCHLKNSSMSPVEEIPICHVGYIVLMLIGLMSPVDFRKRLCRLVEFKGQGSQLIWMDGW